MKVCCRVNSCVTVSPVPLSTELRSGWAAAFAKDSSPDLSWMQARGSRFVGARTCGRTVVGALGMVPVQVGAGDVTFRVDVLHDIWVDATARGTGVLTKLLAVCTQAMSGDEFDGAAVLVNRKRAIGARLISVGFQARTPALLLRGGAVHEPPEARRIQVVKEKRIGAFGYGDVAGILRRAARVDRRTGLIRTAEYLRARFDRAPRAYLSYGIRSRADGRLTGFLLGKTWAPKNAGQVLLFAAEDDATAAVLINDFHRDAVTALGRSAIDITASCAGVHAGLLRRSDYRLTEVERALYVLSNRSEILGEWSLWRDEANVY